MVYLDFGFFLYLGINYTYIRVTPENQKKIILKKTPDNFKKQVLGISGLIFSILTFGIGPTNIFGLEQIILKQTDYFFGVTIYFLDYGLISLIPFFGLMLNSRRSEFKYSKWITNVLIILFWTIISFIIGLYILTFIGKPSNPLIPQYLLTEPIYIYSVFFLGIGIGIPFMSNKWTKKQGGKIHNIGIDE